jgi:hypothetical protein
MDVWMDQAEQNGNLRWVQGRMDTQKLIAAAVQGVPVMLLATSTGNARR